MCHLSDDSATIERNVLKSMAGPRRCQDLVTFSLSIQNVDFGPVHQSSSVHSRIKSGVKRIITEAAGSFDEHYAELTVQPGDRRRLEGAEDKAYPLIPESSQEIVFAEGDSGELVVTALIGLPEDVASRIVREILTKHLSQIEVGVAKFIAKVDVGRGAPSGIIHVRMLKPPSLAPYTSKTDTGDVEDKFLLEDMFRNPGATRGPSALLAVVAASLALASFAVVKLLRRATVVAETETRALAAHLPNGSCAWLDGAQVSSEEDEVA